MDNGELGSLAAIFKLFELKRIIFLILGFIVIGLIARFVSKIATRAQEQFTNSRLIVLQIATIFNFSLYIFGTIGLVYISLRPPRELLLALGGSAAVAIGFSLKDIVASILAGLILLFDRPFQVGDRIQFGDIYGEITSIGLRTVRLTTLDDNLVTIPNSKFLTESVASGNAGALDMMITIDFNLAFDADLWKAKSLLREVVATSRYTYLRKPIAVVAQEKAQGDLFFIELKVKAYVLDVRYEKAFQTDVVMRGNEVLAQNGIGRPVKAVHYISDRSS